MSKAKKNGPDPDRLKSLSTLPAFENLERGEFWKMIAALQTAEQTGIFNQIYDNFKGGNLRPLKMPDYMHLLKMLNPDLVLSLQMEIYDRYKAGLVSPIDVRVFAEGYIRQTQTDNTPEERLNLCLEFSKHPSERVTGVLKSFKFRWNPTARFWYLDQEVAESNNALSDYLTLLVTTIKEGKPIDSLPTADELLRELHQKLQAARPKQTQTKPAPTPKPEPEPFDPDKCFICQKMGGTATKQVTGTDDKDYPITVCFACHIGKPKWSIPEEKMPYV